jgi:hypothetical protein
VLTRLGLVGVGAQHASDDDDVRGEMTRLRSARGQDLTVTVLSCRITASCAFECETFSPLCDVPARSKETTCLFGHEGRRFEWCAMRKDYKVLK